MYPVDTTSSFKSECASTWDLVVWAAARHLTDVSPRKLLFIQQHWPPTGFFLCQMCTWQMFADNSYRRIIISRIYSPLNRANFPVQWARSGLQIKGWYDYALIGLYWTILALHGHLKVCLLDIKKHLHIILRSNTFHCHGSSDIWSHDRSDVLQCNNI